MDPTRGILVVGDVSGREADEEVIRERVLKEYARVSEEEQLIRERLDSHLGREPEESFWGKHEPPIGTAVILRGAAAAWDPKGTDLNPAILVDATDWQALPERLGEALAFYVGDAEEAKDIAPYLIGAVKAKSHPMGGFMDHMNYLSVMDEVMRQL
jgi:hypothetical protein